MPPVLALVLTLGAIAYLLATERRMNPGVSPALWIPLLWVFFIGTRYPSQWIDLGSPSDMTSADEYLDGHPLNAPVFLCLYAAGLVVLVRRRLALSAVVGANAAIVLYFLYCLLSVGWSDFPWTAFKRLIKVLEHVVLALVVLTDPQPARALDALMRRFLVLALPLSVLFIKYYPEYGRGFDFWTGRPVNMGVTLNKNALGHICLLGSLFFSSSLLSPLHRAIAEPIKRRTTIDLCMVIAIVWLLQLADAKTSMVCSILGVLVIVALVCTRFGRHPTAFVIVLVASGLVIAALDMAFGLREATIEALGRNVTLTDRTFVWEDVLAVPNNPLLGTGFESFWLGERVQRLWAKHWWRPNQAHNGSIETYINLGAIGVAFLAVMVTSAFGRSLRRLGAGEPFAPIGVAFLFAVLILNYTDATFTGLHLLFFGFFLFALQAPAGVDPLSRTPTVRRKGVHDGQDETAVPGGVSPADGRAGGRRQGADATGA